MASAKRCGAREQPPGADLTLMKLGHRHACDAVRLCFTLVSSPLLGPCYVQVSNLKVMSAENPERLYAAISVVIYS